MALKREWDQCWTEMGSAEDKMGQDGTKWDQIGTKEGPKWDQIETNVVPKLIQNGTKL